MVILRHDTFDEPELIPEFFGAKLFPEKKEELKRLFNPEF